MLPNHPARIWLYILRGLRPTSVYCSRAACNGSAETQGQLMLMHTMERPTDFRYVQVRSMVVHPCRHDELIPIGGSGIQIDQEESRGKVQSDDGLHQMGNKDTCQLSRFNLGSLIFLSVRSFLQRGCHTRHSYCQKSPATRERYHGDCLGSLFGNE